MTGLEKIINDLSEAIGNASDSFNSQMDGLQKGIYDDVSLLIKDLDITNGKIDNTVNNVKAIGAIKAKIEKIILNPDYIDSVKSYVDAFNAVSSLQDSYFKQISTTAGPKNLLLAIKQQSIEQTVTSLTEGGIGAGITNGIRDILKRNITGGASYNDLLDQMRNYILTNNSGTGALEKYTKQITTDSLQQFSRQYGQVLANDLDMEWFMYVGSNRRTSREFCILLTKKKYIHRSEFADIVNGIIDGVQIKINPNTNTWSGGIPGTDENNLQINCGGYTCEHSMYPISSELVPANVKDIFGKEPAANYNERNKELNNLSSDFTDKQINKASGGISAIHKNADKRDLVLNKETVSFLRDFFGDKAIIRKHTSGENNPELEINGKIADRKTPNPDEYKNIWSPIFNRTRSALEQGCESVVFHLETKYDKESILNGINAAFNLSVDGKQIEEITIIFKNKSGSRITRNDYESGVAGAAINKGYIAP